MTKDHPNDLLPAYTLGCLDTEELERVQNHLQQCGVCQAEVARLENLSALLASAVPEQEPRPILRERVLTRCRPQRRLAWFDVLLDRWPRLVPTMALGSLMVCLLAGSFSLLFWFSPMPERTEPFETLQIVTMNGTQKGSHASGRLLVAPDSAQGLLIVYDLPPLSPDLQYQLWLIQNGQRSNGGVFSVAKDGSAHILITASQPLVVFDSFGVTIEPFGGSPAPTGKKVMEGKVLSGLLGFSPRPLNEFLLRIDKNSQPST